jgi:hypothetical protein
MWPLVEINSRKCQFLDVIGPSLHHLAPLGEVVRVKVSASSKRPHRVEAAGELKAHGRLRFGQNLILYVTEISQENAPGSGIEIFEAAGVTCS